GHSILTSSVVLCFRKVLRRQPRLSAECVLRKRTNLSILEWCSRILVSHQSNLLLLHLRKRDRQLQTRSLSGYLYRVLRKQLEGQCCPALYSWPGILRTISGR